MQKQNIEPLILILRHEHPNPITPQLEMHPLVLDISHSVECQTGVAFPEEDRFDCDSGILSFGIVYREIEFTHVVDEAGDGEHV